MARLPAAPPLDHSPSATPLTPPGGQVRFAAFQSRNFRRLWIGLMITNTGTWMAAVAEGWLITDLEPERKSFYVGLVSLCFAVPMTLLPPLGGVLADRIPRLKLLWITQVAFLLMNATVATITLAGRASVGMVLAAAAVTGIILSLDSPARHSLVPDLVPREHLTSAVSLQSASFSGATLLGSAVGGALIPVIGVGGVFAVNAISSVATLVSLSLIGPFAVTQRTGGAQRVAEAMQMALRYIAATPRIRNLLLLSTLSGLLARSHVQLLTVFSRDIYQIGASAHGLLVAGSGVGAIAGAVLLGASRRQVTRAGAVIVACLLLQALLALIMSLSDVYAVGIVVEVLFAMTIAVAAALMTTIVQSTTPPELRARVMSFLLLTYISAPTIGAFLVGALAQAATLQWVIGVAAVALALATIVTVTRDHSLLE